MKFYNHVPTECPTLCTLSAQTLGEERANIVAALYQGPDGSDAAYRRRVSLYLDREVARATINRHIEHLRATNWPRWGDEPGEFTYPNKEAALATLLEADEDEPNPRDGILANSIRIVESATDWQRAMDDASAILDAEIWAYRPSEDKTA